MAVESPEFNAVIPGYDVGPIIGRGGSAIVRSAVEVTTGRDVAMKFAINGTLPGDNTNPFGHEIAVQRRLGSHPNIVGVYQSGVIEDPSVHGTRLCHFFVMPLASESFEDTIKKAGGTLPPGAVVPAIREVGAGLSHAHDNGVLHRDVKPPNVLLVNGRYSLTDFGNASTAHRLYTVHSVTIQPRVGTLGFAPPELFVGDGRKPSDIFSMGAMVTRALTGTVPYIVEYGIDYHQRLLAARREQFDERVPMTDTLAEIEPVVAKSVSLDAADRQQSVDEFVDELTEAHARGAAKQQRARVNIGIGAKASGGSGAARKSSTHYGHTPQDPLLHGPTVDYEHDPTTPFHDGLTGPYDSADPTSHFHDGKTVPVRQDGAARVGDRRPTQPFHDGRTRPVAPDDLRRTRPAHPRSPSVSAAPKETDRSEPKESTWSIIDRLIGLVTLIGVIPCGTYYLHHSRSNHGSSAPESTPSASQTQTPPPGFRCDVRGVIEGADGVKLQVYMPNYYGERMAVLGGGYAAAAVPESVPRKIAARSYSVTYIFKPNEQMRGTTTLKLSTDTTRGVDCNGKFRVGTQASGDESFVNG